MNGYNISCTPSLPRLFGSIPKSRRELQKELLNRDSIIHNFKTALREAEKKFDDARLDAQIAKDELEDERKEYEDTAMALMAKNEEADHLRNQLLCLRGNFSDIAAGNFEKVYENICDTLDPEGWRLYRAAEAYTGVDPSHAFPTEDNLGYFEVLDGTGLIYWVEVSAFGECEYRQLNCGGGYELSTEQVIHKDTEEYKQYRKTICEQAVRQLLGLEAAENA